MSFDWMSFATGFMERTTEIREQRREEAKQFEEEQRQAAQRNAQLISRRRAIADQVTGYANYLTRNGVSNEQLQAVISSGPQAIEALTSRVQAAVQANGGRPLGSSDVASLISMPEGFTPLDMTTQEFIDQTYGLAVTPLTREEREFSLLDRLGGRDQMARARDRLNRTAIVEGMTIEEINAAAMQGDYQSLIPGTFASIVGSSAYDFDASTDFTVTFERRLATLQDSDRWKQTLGLAPEEQEAAQAALLEEAMGPIIRMGMSTYGDAFLADQESYLRSIMGDGFMDSLIDEETSPPTREEETPTTTTAEPAETTEAIPTGSDVVTPSSTTTVDPALRGDGTPAGTEDGIVTTTLPPLGTGEQPVVSTEAPTMPTPTTAPPPVAPRAEEVQIPADANQLPEPPADATVNVEGSGVYTYAQWQDMTREERVSAGLPTSQIGAQFYFNRFAAGIGGMPSIDDLVGPAGEGDPEQRQLYEQLSEAGVDDTSIALLGSHGSDMIEYLLAKGASTEEEMFTALSEWGQENNIVMPFDKSALIYALKPHVQQ
jgi:hypothetical protein